MNTFKVINSEKLNKKSSRLWNRATKRQKKEGKLFRVMEFM